MGKPIYLKQLQLGPLQNFIYLIGDPDRREAVVIDPGWEVPTILEALQRDGYRLTGAVATHGHFDHVMGLGPLLDAIDVPVYIHPEDAGSLQVEQSAIKTVSDGDVIQVGDVPINCLHTPGHTPGSQCLLVNDQLFTGDTLFIRAVGRWDLPGGDPRALYESLASRLKHLDEKIRVYPGHHYAAEPQSTIGDEKRRNPFFQPATVEEFLHLIGQPA